MKIFLDTEFTGLHQNTTLISLVMIAETGEAFYAEFNDFDQSQITDWLRDNVINKLEMGAEKEFFLIDAKTTKMKSNSERIRKELYHWLSRFDCIEIWADVLAYDWVLFCQLFGGAKSIPENIFYAPFDLATFFRIKGLIDPVNKYEKDVSRFAFAEVNLINQHNALTDAHVAMLCFQKLSN